MATNGDRPGVHPPNEQYLEAIFNLEEEGNQVIQARLAERVGHAAPTVSEMVHRLKEAGYIDAHGRSLSLTPSGRELAIGVIRKHRLVERLLTDVIGLPWHKVHAEADRWEHVLSDEVEARLVEILGNPSTCPHGNFIPRSGRPPVPATALSDALVGQRVKLARVSEIVELDMDALIYLEEHNFIPGCEATVAARGPDGSVVLDAVGATLVLGAALAKLLYFTPAELEEPAEARPEGGRAKLKLLN
jgi:DtxR family transcriptional regulator, Mn-dependent transcriptional regulator